MAVFRAMLRILGFNPGSECCVDQPCRVEIQHDLIMVIFVLSVKHNLYGRLKFDKATTINPKDSFTHNTKITAICVKILVFSSPGTTSMTMIMPC